MCFWRAAVPLQSDCISRAQRSLVYQRAKGEPDNQPFGTQLNVGAVGYEWVNHSMSPTKLSSQEAMEECLRKVPEIEGWDQTTFAMPQALKKKPARAL